MIERYISFRTKYFIVVSLSAVYICAYLKTRCEKLKEVVMNLVPDIAFVLTYNCGGSFEIWYGFDYSEMGEKC